MNLHDTSSSLNQRKTIEKFLKIDSIFLQFHSDAEIRSFDLIDLNVKEQDQEYPLDLLLQ